MASEPRAPLEKDDTTTHHVLREGSLLATAALLLVAHERPGVPRDERPWRPCAVKCATKRSLCPQGAPGTR
eukprot:2098803-Pyramimonas_sp.AAC.1